MLINFKIALAWKKEHQIDLAMRTGVDPTLLSSVINERRQATPELRTKLAAALGVSERWPFGECTGPLTGRRGTPFQRVG